MPEKANPGPGVHYVMVKGDVVYFTFSERFGPWMTDRLGDPLKKQPISERHPFWAPFEAWLAAHRRAHG